MANDKELQMEEGGKKKSKMMIIIIAVVVLLGGGGAAAFFLLTGDEQVEEQQAGTDMPAEQTVSDAPNNGKAIYVAMPRPFTFNAPSLSRERLVQIDVQLMVRGAKSEGLAKQHIPLIEGKLLEVFSAFNAEELVSETGKIALRDKATSRVRAVMQEIEGNRVVEQVLFTGFVIQ